MKRNVATDLLCVIAALTAWDASWLWAQEKVELKEAVVFELPDFHICPPLTWQTIAESDYALAYSGETFDGIQSLISVDLTMAYPRVELTNMVTQLNEVLQKSAAEPDFKILQNFDCTVVDKLAHDFEYCNVNDGKKIHIRQILVVQGNLQAIISLQCADSVFVAQNHIFDAVLATVQLK